MVDRDPRAVDIRREVRRWERSFNGWLSTRIRVAAEARRTAHGAPPPRTEEPTATAPGSAPIEA
jgi:hypothetical protein